DGLFDEGLLERRDRPFDQAGPVIRHLHLHSGWQRAGELADLLLHPADHIEHVLALADDHDASHGLAVAVPLEQAAPDVGTEADGGDVLHQNRRSQWSARAQGSALDGAQVLDVPAALHVVFAAAELENATAYVRIGVADPGDHLFHGDAIGAQPFRVDGHLVLALETPDARHFRDSRHLPDRVAEGEVLERAQLIERVAARGIHQRVLEAPADAGGVWSEGRRDALWKAGAKRIHVLEDAAARPVGIRPLLEDDVHERHPEHRVAAHVGDLG